MIAPEVIRAFVRWYGRESGGSPPLGTYPEWRDGYWYMRESLSSYGTTKRVPRVWRLEDDFSFEEVRA